MKRYGAHDWRSEPTILITTSPSGGGKTYRVCAIGIAAREREHDVVYLRIDDLARRLVIAPGDGIAHQDLLTGLSDTDLLRLDDFLTVGSDPDAASDLFAILANREHRLPTLIARQSGPGYWVEALLDRVAADSIVNWLANHAREINLGQIDMRERLDQRSRASANHLE